MTAKKYDPFGEWCGDWVAFDADGFPFGFARKTSDCATMAKAGKEFPSAVRIELVTDMERRKKLLLQHADGRKR